MITRAKFVNAISVPGLGTELSFSREKGAKITESSKRPGIEVEYNIDGKRAGCMFVPWTNIVHLQIADDAVETKPEKLPVAKARETA